ncbi:ROK family protein [Streptomyces canus]|uniref:ROK family protein n=1 Tax=Streptomyces canus TaxID=58343 RepID=UPI0030E56A57
MTGAEGVVLAVDIGGTKAVLRARGPDTDSGDLRFEWPAPVQCERDVDLLRATARQALRLAGTARALRVVVAFPGTLDAAGHVTRWPTRPAWCGLRLADELSEFGEVPPTIRDDAVLAGYAEAVARPALRDGMLYLGLGTGVGGAWLSPRPDRDPADLPGVDDLLPCEAGHLIVHPDTGRSCDCGRRGCLQAHASGPAVHRWTTAHGRPAALTDAAAACGLAITNIGELLPLAAVVLGGGFGAGDPGLPPALRAALRRRARQGGTVPRVLRASYGAQASLRGALLLARAFVGAC